MNKKQTRFLILLVELLITFIVLYIAYHFIKTSFINSYNRGTEIFQNDNLPYVEKNITVEENDNILDFAIKLKNENLINNAYGFIFESYLMGNVEDVVPGTFKLNSNMSPYQFFLTASTSNTGLNENEISITIKEGYTLSDIGEYLESLELVTYDEFMDTANNYKFDYSFLPNTENTTNNLEGYLFPDTYRIYKNATSEEIINKMLEKFELVYNQEIITMMNDTDKSLNEIITIASIIEKEVKVPAERTQASSVIYNRLEQNINLGMCSSILYILDKRKEHLTDADLKIESPYNTYANAGLPIGPISNPGISCISAAIYPEDTNLLYFVIDDEEEGSHYFTNNYDEFLAAKEKYNQKY